MGQDRDNCKGCYFNVGTIYSKSVVCLKEKQSDGCHDYVLSKFENFDIEDVYLAGSYEERFEVNEGHEDITPNYRSANF